MKELNLYLCSFQEVRRMTTTESVSPSFSFYPFSTSTLNDILGKFSELSLKNIILGYMFMVSSLYHLSKFPDCFLMN